MINSYKIKRCKQFLLHQRYWNRYFYFSTALLFAIFYLCQHINIAPNAADGALILEYIRMVSEGKRSYWDFIDIYGPFTWYLPALFFKIFGHKIIGIRVWLLCLKLFSIILTYKIVKKSKSTFYACLTASVTMVLLGQPWQYLQTAYSFHTALPLTFLTFYIIIFEPFNKKIWNLIFSGLLTALIIWTKLNSGMFLLSGGLFYYFYWIYTSKHNGYFKNSYVKIFKSILITGLFLYGIIFYLFISQYFNKVYFIYLLFPLLLSIGWTFNKIISTTYTKNSINFNIASWFLYFCATIFFLLIFYLIYFGWKDGKLYISEIFQLLKNLDYMVPFKPLGIKGLYTGFNENYWLQLPWFMTFLFCIWIIFQRYLKPEKIFRQKWQIIKARCSGLFILASLCSFIIYSRSDETHIFQAILPTVPVIFFLLSNIESFVVYQRIQLKVPIRLFILILVGLMISTIGTIPSFQIFKTKKYIWNNQSLSYLKLTSEKRYVYHRSDLLTNKAAQYIDSITKDYTPVLILSENQLLNYNSHTVPVGGRYQYLFYLLRSGLIDRKAFDLLVPDTVLKNLLDNPPKVITDIHGHSPLLKKIPEFKTLLQNRYILTKQFGHIFIYEKNR